MGEMSTDGRGCDRRESMSVHLGGAVPTKGAEGGRAWWMPTAEGRGVDSAGREV
jgi:hypothetical protein